MKTTMVLWCFLCGCTVNDVGLPSRRGSTPISSVTDAFVPVVIDVPVHDGPVHDGTVHYGPDIGGPVADGPVADGPVADGPVADGPVADGPVADGPVADGPAADGPAADGPVADGPVADGSVANDPVIDGGWPDSQPDSSFLPDHQADLSDNSDLPTDLTSDRVGSSQDVAGDAISADLARDLADSSSKKPLGTHCGNPSQCASGFCTDGVCCAVALCRDTCVPSFINYCPVYNGWTCAPGGTCRAY